MEQVVQILLSYPSMYNGLRGLIIFYKCNSNVFVETCDNMVISGSISYVCESVISQTMSCKKKTRFICPI